MKYFDYFPKVQYGEKTLTDITVRAKIRDLIKQTGSLFYDYYVKDEDRPDTVAHKYYFSSNYTWLVLYANDIFDVDNDWPRNYEKFKNYIEDKYGSIYSASTTTHHLEDADGNVIDQETYDSLSSLDRVEVTNYTYEEMLNEEKRSIKLIDERYRNHLVTEIRRLFK